MNAAFGERGIRRFPVGQTNPRIVEYNYHTNLRGYDDKISWCSSFMNWCLAQVGIAGTGSALARSWLEWGIPLESPVPGCIAVLTRDDPNSWKGHVGFFLRIEGDSVVLFGGNQLEEVREHYYPVKSVLSYRWPGPKAEAGAGLGSSTVGY
ncbi:TIGR02594 family protein [Duganella sp. LjRoot269]|jgi:uncharacterized protein (TIGR02594 family)|uniref:TIGR02594 family protein n=1 Tax=Duganella sp. LjRoot269 TaxID=3342305 RepID=UPI003ECD6738